MDTLHTNTLVVTQGILGAIAEIEEFKGAWKASGQLAPEQLEKLQRTASIENIISSIRIDGGTITAPEAEALLGNQGSYRFDTPDQQEAAGYSEALDFIFRKYGQVQITESNIKQLHSQLLKYTYKDELQKGNYKKTSNQIEAFDPDGKSMGVIFHTAGPFETPGRMSELVKWASDSLEKKSMHPLLVTSVFIISFLAISPFQEGNGSLSRLLIVYMLLKTGYIYAPYTSVEAIIEEKKSTYYQALRQTQGTIRSLQPDWQPWLNFFFEVLRQQKQRLETKIEEDRSLVAQIPPLSLRILEMIKLNGRITNSEIVTNTGANRNTVKKHLEALVSSAYLQLNGTGKGSWYSLKNV
ncbi:MAG: Fic family protein [Taibaiella sp.]|nr:Fic family protein [Taibaiella sp.]